MAVNSSTASDDNHALTCCLKVFRSSTPQPITVCALTHCLAGARSKRSRAQWTASWRW